MSNMIQVKNILLQVASLDNNTSAIDSNGEKAIVAKLMSSSLCKNFTPEENHLLYDFYRGKPVTDEIQRKNINRAVKYPKSEIQTNNVLAKRMGLKNAEYYIVKYDSDGDAIERTYYDKKNNKIATWKCKYSADKNNKAVTYFSYLNSFSLSLNLDKFDNTTDFQSFIKKLPITIAQYLNDNL